MDTFLFIVFPLKLFISESIDANSYKSITKRLYLMIFICMLKVFDLLCYMKLHVSTVTISKKPDLNRSEIYQIPQPYRYTRIAAHPF